MKLIKLYIENFMCHEKSIIDFSLFNTALIVGKVSSNELYSNGVGKTTIFKAIEYVLFNQADVNLEKIIRDGENSTKIVLDFHCNNNIYRLSRIRTKKGNTDLSLYERTTNLGSNEDVFSQETNEKFWKDISGRRSSDTEKDLAKLIKINFKSFRSTVHFMQNDFSGLTTSTPEKRKGILKDALNLIVYLKLEKVAKDTAAKIAKDIDKNKTIIETLGNPNADLLNLSKQLNDIENILISKENDLLLSKETLSSYSKKNLELANQYSIFENKISSINNSKNLLAQEKRKNESSYKEYITKKTNISLSLDELNNELNQLRLKQIDLASIDYSIIDNLLSKIDICKNDVSVANNVMQNNISLYEELKIPIPDENKCKHCRQVLTDEHKVFCKKLILDEMEKCQSIIKSSKSEISRLNKLITSYQQEINTFLISKKQLEDINTKISSKLKDIESKNNFYKEYDILEKKFKEEIDKLGISISELDLELVSYSNDHILSLKKMLDDNSAILASKNLEINALNKEINHQSNLKAVINHSISERNNELIKLGNVQKSLDLLESKYKIYPLVIDSFSKIPNLIIQNVLDDLQIESNNLLAKLKPGLQLSFSIEKTKGDGTQDETLDINYIVNGKSRDYDQLSGAMKLAVTFSLKLGLSFLLQKSIGTNVEFLLLDEIDQSLDKASVDAFAEIVKFFQTSYTILIITHNDRLKDKFSHAILVEQDIDMVSNASVVSSW
jgi:DNA repair exonuclease SbcCD ATPase subunit